MTVETIVKDPATLTLTMTATFQAPIEGVWQLWADPRKLERWWGPPTYPAKVGEHDLVPGGRVTYVMTGPEGDTYHGWWHVVAVDEPRSLEVVDGFADDSGTPNPDMPTTTMLVVMSESQGVTRMVATSRFTSLESMEKLVAMGMEEGLTTAIGQIDAILAA
jgi:uncharacterized protein YndB with AHSA1/START domain